jgi:hypothetical protein
LQSNAGNLAPNHSAAVRLEPGQVARNIAERRADLGAEGCNGNDTDHGDQADEHAIFDQRRALVVTAEAINQLAHQDILRCRAKDRLCKAKSTGFAPFAEERILSIDESIIEGGTRLKKILSKMR